ncbi:HEP2 [Auxenochlorella protothecoides x Auxenochlorella symbiontica]
MVTTLRSSCVPCMTQTQRRMALKVSTPCMAGQSMAFLGHGPCHTRNFFRTGVACPSIHPRARARTVLQSLARSDAVDASPFDDVAAASPGDAAREESRNPSPPRRTLSVTFTCNKCGGRTERAVNPVAWTRGLVIAQCGECDAWHKLADAANLVDEIRYSDEV